MHVDVCTYIHQPFRYKLLRFRPVIWVFVDIAHWDYDLHTSFDGHSINSAILVAKTKSSVGNESVHVLIMEINNYFKYYICT